MSSKAMAWALRLPLDACDHAAFRVLIRLADLYNDQNAAAWTHTATIASELGCTKRTVQRALRSLEILGLIVRGDQRFVQHLRADRRPVVWSLNLGLWHPVTEQPALPLDEPDEPDEVTAGVTPQQPVDNSDGVTPAVAHGVTPAVALEQEPEQSQELPRRPQSAREVACVGQRSGNVFPSHYFPPGATYCDTCGISRDAQRRIDWISGEQRPA